MNIVDIINKNKYRKALEAELKLIELEIQILLEEGKK